MRGLIIIPAYNEEENIERVVQDLIENAVGFDYVIINDCSTDNTKYICEKNGYNVINLPVNLGIGGAMQTGYKYAKQQNYDIAVQFDGDGQHDAQYLTDLLSIMNQDGADMVIGSRFIDKKGFQSTGTRRLGINIINRLIKVCTGVKITDSTSGYRMINKKIIDSFCRYYPNDYPEPESIVASIRRGFRIRECTVEMRERMGGESSITFYKSFYYMFKVSMAILIDKLKWEGT